jgi:hypothetical protein
MIKMHGRTQYSVNLLYMVKQYRCVVYIKDLIYAYSILNLMEMCGLLLLVSQGFGSRLEPDSTSSLDPKSSRIQDHKKGKKGRNLII